MASITASGIGSGLDVNGLVDQLLTAEAQAPTIRLDRREADLQVQLSGYGAIRGSLAGLQSSLTSLQNPATFRGRTITSSDSDILTVTSSHDITEAGYDINVTTLAESHKLSTDPTLAAAQFTDVTDQLGTGTLTFKFGTNDYNAGTDTYSGFTQNPERATETVTITDGSLQGVRDAINQADIGVTASIIYDGDYYRLAITSDETGEANGIQLTVDDDDLDDSDTSGLSLLAFNAAATNIEQTDAAVDAALTINGIGITSASNTVTGAIEDATLNLKGTGSADVSVQIDKSRVSNAVTAFVANYNSFIDSVNQLTAYDPDTGQAGALNGDAITRGIVSNVRRLISDPVGEVGETLTILAEIGVTTDAETGRLQLDQSELNEQLDTNFDRFVSLFAAYGAPTDAGIEFVSVGDDAVAGDYAINITTAASRGDLVASAAANTTITAGVNDTLEIEIDGTSATITLAAGSYAIADLVSEVQAQINNHEDISNAGASVIVTESAGVLTLTSQSYGADSSVQITGGNGQVDLVGAAATSTDGNDVAGTIGGVAATGNGRLLTGTGDAAGIVIEVSGTALGARGTLDFNRGYADRLDDYLDSIVNVNGLLDSTTDSLKDRIEDINDERVALEARLVRIETRLRAQFSALDSLISNLTATSDFLTQQLASLPKIGGGNSGNN